MDNNNSIGKNKVKNINKLDSENNNNQLDLLTSSEQFFTDIVSEALINRQIETSLSVQKYLVNLLNHYLDSRNLFGLEDFEILNCEFITSRPPETLAEMLLIANNSEEPQRTKLFKRLADKSLYMSGFFGDSLDRKIVDVDYYVNMGGTAYGFLAQNSREEYQSQIYATFANRFYDFVDVLTYISQKSFTKNNESLLRLYDRYLRTGSSLARDRLLEAGVLPVSEKAKKSF